MDEQRPSQFTSVWLARHHGLLDFDCRVANLVIRRMDRPWNDAEVRNVMLAGLVLRGTAFVVRTDDGPGAQPMPMSSEEWLQLCPWPGGARIKWPPKYTVTDDRLLGRLAYYRDWAALPNLPNFVRDTAGWRSK